MSGDPQPKTETDTSTVMASTKIQESIPMKESFTSIRSTAGAPSTTKMEISTREPGRTAKNKEKEF